MVAHTPSLRDGGEKSQELSETDTVSLRSMWAVPDCLENSEDELENYILCFCWFIFFGLFAYQLGPGIWHFSRYTLIVWEAK